MKLMATTASVFSISVRSLFAALLLCILPFPPAAAAHEARIVIEYEYSDARDFHEELAGCGGGLLGAGARERIAAAQSRCQNEHDDGQGLGKAGSSKIGRASCRERV